MYAFAFKAAMARGSGRVQRNVIIIPMSKSQEWWDKAALDRQTYFYPHSDRTGTQVKGHARAAVVKHDLAWEWGNAKPPEYRQNASPRNPAGGGPASAVRLPGTAGRDTFASPKMTGSPLLVLTTLGSLDDARRLVRNLVDQRLVACGTVLPGATSIYRWRGGITDAAEVVVLLKTMSTRWDALRDVGRQQHP